uniref:Transcription elongation factor A N-terminal and central domain containing n=1 Tax=Sphaeramia orbicularis TaxID=375764 RepID=A0A673C101_9TELE
FAKQENEKLRYGDIMALLGDLDKLHITAEQLEATDVVKVLYRLLKSCKDEGAKKTVKHLLTKWKRQYSKERQGIKCTDERKDTELSCDVSAVDETGDGDKGICKKRDSCSSSQTCDTGASAKQHTNLQTLAAQTSSAFPDLSSVRPKCVQLLLSALRPEPSDQDKAASLAEDIEKNIYEHHKSCQIKYKICVRSKIANLKNPKSSHLRSGLLSGLLSPEAFAQMSVEEMASTELRQLREEYSSLGVKERQLPQGVEGTQTQKIRCKQAGPDEDAMTFVTCSLCGQQWYHSGWICF